MNSDTPHNEMVSHLEKSKMIARKFIILINLRYPPVCALKCFAKI